MPISASTFSSPCERWVSGKVGEQARVCNWADHCPWKRLGGRQGYPKFVWLKRAGLWKSEGYICASGDLSGPWPGVWRISKKTRGHKRQARELGTNEDHFNIEKLEILCVLVTQPCLLDIWAIRFYQEVARASACHSVRGPG